MKSAVNSERICRIIKKDEGSITFEVDENLTPAKPLEQESVSGMDLAKALTKNYPKRGEEKLEIIKTSFESEEMLLYRGRDPFFNMMTLAYGEHRPVVLSPDAIWLLICQGFNRFVNADPERHRKFFVSHQGRRTMESKKDDFGGLENEDWEGMVKDLSKLIADNTVSDISAIITSNYSTTGSVERTASRITLMDTVKEYFEYVSTHYICGIPAITLTGTPEDWKELYRKARLLKQYGVSAWIRKLEYILREFVRAAEGHPKQVFWRSIVKKYRPRVITRPRGCVWQYDRLSKVDGWILRFFPVGADAETEKKVLFHYSMPIEMVSVPFRFQLVDGENVMVRYAMELYAGFVGLKENPETLALTPQIGWMVCRKKRQ